jgi:hypothetical protein
MRTQWRTLQGEVGQLSYLVFCVMFWYLYASVELVCPAIGLSSRSSPCVAFVDDREGKKRYA